MISYGVLLNPLARVRDGIFSAFDVILSRHALVNAKECVRVPRQGGLFITQQVGNPNICGFFGCEPSGHFRKNCNQKIQNLTEEFQRLERTVESHQEYDVDYWFSNIESFHVLAEGHSLIRGFFN